MKKAQDADPDVRILKSAVCPSLTNKSKLTYQVGRRGDSELLLRILSNSGGGHFSPEWVSLAKVYEIFQKKSGEKGFTSGAFRHLFKGRSVNSAGFLVAAFKDLGVLVAREGKSRVYDAHDLPGFVATLQGLLQSDSAKSAGTSGQKATKGTKVGAPASPKKTARKPSPGKS